MTLAIIDSGGAISSTGTGANAGTITILGTGGGGSQTSFGPRSASNIMHRMTTVSFVLFVVLSLALAILSGKQGTSVMETVETPVVPVVEEVIIEEGGYANDFYAIEEGTVQVTKAGEKVATLGAGDVFGEQGLLERQERSASVIAETVVRALKIEHWELSRMRKAMPEVVEDLLKTVHSRD